MTPETAVALCTGMLALSGVIITALLKRKPSSCITEERARKLLGTGSVCRGQGEAIAKIKGGLTTCENEVKHGADLISEVRTDVKSLMQSVTRIETKLNGNE